MPWEYWRLAGKIVMGYVSYGVPYKGSKREIAQFIVDNMSVAETFVDLFAGGCAVTHAAMLSGKYKRFVANDIDKMPIALFKDAMDGKFHNERRWISRENFFKMKDNDAYVKICWSFGNAGSSYMYSREIEPYKKAFHYAVVLDEWDLFREFLPEVFETVYKALRDVKGSRARRLRTGWAIVEGVKAAGDSSLLDKNAFYRSVRTAQRRGHYPHLASLERVERLRFLEMKRPENLEMYNTDYTQVDIPKNSVVYCDPPYFGTTGYNGMIFNHERFYDWLRTRDYPVWVSEYRMPNDFVCVATTKKKEQMCAMGVNIKEEKLFIYKRWADKVWHPTLF